VGIEPTDNLFRLRIKTAKAEIKVFIVVKDSNLGALAGRFAFIWLGLSEVGDRLDLRPRQLIEMSVNLDIGDDPPNSRHPV